MTTPAPAREATDELLLRFQPLLPLIRVAIRVAERQAREQVEQGSVWDRSADTAVTKASYEADGNGSRLATESEKNESGRGISTPSLAKAPVNSGDASIRRGGERDVQR